MEYYKRLEINSRPTPYEVNLEIEEQIRYNSNKLKKAKVEE